MKPGIASRLLTIDGRESPRRASPAEVTAMYNGVGRCSKPARKAATLCHFSTRSTRLPGGGARAASRFVGRRLDLRHGFPSEREAAWHEAPRKLPHRVPSAVHSLKPESLP